MSRVLKLAVLAGAVVTALAFAGNALAVQKLSVAQTATSLTIKVTQAQTDAQPAKITIYVPTGYSINTSAAPGTTIGTTSGSIFARDANIPLPLSGNVVVAPPDTNAPGCATGTHLAVWNLALSVAGQAINLPVHVDPTAGAEAALGAYKMVVCLAPADVPQGTPGRVPNGAATKFTARTAASGAYSLVLRKKGKKSTTTFQGRTTVAERDVTATLCATPSLPPIPCVSGTASGFTAVSNRVRIRL